jgi:hypothetical protein
MEGKVAPGVEIRVAADRSTLAGIALVVMEPLVLSHPFTVIPILVGRTD